MKTDSVSTSRGTDTFPVEEIRRDFPALEQQVHNRPLIYFDNAATTQKPRLVIEAINRFYGQDCSNVHRGVHTLSERATRDYEQAREKVRGFINARSTKEIIFVRGATEAINLVAQCFGRARVHRGDEVIVSAMEHHSDIVPWQMLCEAVGATLLVVPMSDRGELDLEVYKTLFSPKTKIVGVVHISNALGTVNPVKKMTEIAHSHGVPILIDGAQGAPHLPVDVQALGCDFYAFSSHKMYGPTGVGVLYGREEILETMPPYQGGGDMITSVTFEKTTYNSLPYRFEAGTPNIAGVIGLGAAIDYLAKVGKSRIEAYEQSLLEYATQKVGAIPGVRLIGTAEHKAGVLSFLIDDIHPHDVGTLMDQEGIAIRTGHHCAQPVMDRLGIPATCRASFSFYNTYAEVDALVRAIGKVKEVFA